ncbi:MAG: hypothetical protein H6922_00635 [Pseudomonadaceae bacterium]|nr:hypothetical protein [Pseudomonadaceae bacterium]
MRHVALMFALLVLPLAAPHALEDRAMQLELQRYDQIMGKLQSQNEQLMSQVRELQRENLALKKGLEAVAAKSEATADRMQQVENVNVRNVEAAQRQLNEALSAQANNRYDWGGQTRDCPEIGVKHQQIKVQTKPDGSKTVRFLCFDGKAVHLGTEVHDVTGN